MFRRTRLISFYYVQEERAFKRHQLTQKETMHRLILK